MKVVCHETPARFLWILPAQRAGAAGRAAVKIQTGPPAAPQAEHQGQQDIQAQLGEPDAIFQRLVPTFKGARSSLCGAPGIPGRGAGAKSPRLPGAGERGWVWLII